MFQWVLKITKLEGCSEGLDAFIVFYNYLRDASRNIIIVGCTEL